MTRWLPHVPEYLDELLRHKGCCWNPLTDSCPQCNEYTDSVYRCCDCFGGQLICCECLLKMHVQLPSHHPEVCHTVLSQDVRSTISSHQRWTGTFFEKTSVINLGAMVQLGHGGDTCPCPYPSPTVLTIIRANGVHSVQVSWCECKCMSGSNPR